MVVYGVEQGLYRTSFTVSSAGALSICAPPGAGAVFVGAGDGRLRKISGSSREWALQHEVQLMGGVTSLSSSSDGAEMLAATTAGLLYRVLCSNMTYTVIGEAHTAAITDVAVPHNRSDRFATCSADGSVRVWDLSDYTTTCRYDSRPLLPRCLVFDASDHDLLLSGWSDGGLRALDTRDYQCPVAWQLANAHRGPVTCVVATDTYLLTAGDDGVVRVWTVSNRECVAMLQDHKHKVTGVLVDNTTSRIVHTVGADRCLLSYDLSRRDGQSNSKQPMRIAAKSDTEGSGFTSLCQRIDHEREIVASTADGRILFYDIDYAQPVHAVTDRARVRVNSVALSPQGTYLCVAQQDGLIVIYALQRDTAGGVRAIAQARCHSAEAVSARWTGDGRQIVSIGAEGETCVWNFFLPS